MQLPNISAKTFSFSAVLLGYLLIDDLTANEQNALGNWLMLTAQVLSTNAFYKQVQQERENLQTQKNFSSISMEEGLEILRKMVNRLQKELEEWKR